MPEHPPIDGFERLRDSIREELRVQSSLRRLVLGDELLRDLADAVATNVDYAFRYEWAPKWVRPGAPHRWADGEASFVECLRCGWVFSDPQEGAASRAYEAHVGVEHGGEG